MYILIAKETDSLKTLSKIISVNHTPTNDPFITMWLTFIAPLTTHKNQACCAHEKNDIFHNFSCFQPLLGGLSLHLNHLIP